MLLSLLQHISIPR